MKRKQCFLRLGKFSLYSYIRWYSVRKPSFQKLAKSYDSLEQGENGSIKLTSLIISTVTLISCTKWLFYCRNKIHFMVIHKMYCFLFILLSKLLHYFQYSHYITCKQFEYEDCSYCDMFLCQFETGSEYRSETFNNVIR